MPDCPNWVIAACLFWDRGRLARTERSEQRSHLSFARGTSHLSVLGRARRPRSQ